MADKTGTVTTASTPFGTATKNTVFKNSTGSENSANGAAAAAAPRTTGQLWPRGY